MKRFFSIVFAATTLSCVQADKSLMVTEDLAANSLPRLESQLENSTYLSESSNGGYSDVIQEPSKSENKAENCPGACPNYYDPVIDESGKTYSNECFMRIANCKGAKEDMGSMEDLKRLYLHPFGASRDGSATDGLSDGSSKSNHKAESCPDACLERYDPVVDENGKTYSNECFMHMAKCKDTKKDEDLLSKFKRLYGHSFGASRDGSAADNSN